MTRYKQCFLSTSVLFVIQLERHSFYKNCHYKTRPDLFPDQISYEVTKAGFNFYSHYTVNVVPYVYAVSASICSSLAGILSNGRVDLAGFFAQRLPLTYPTVC